MSSCIGFVFCVVVGLLLCALKVQAQKVRGEPGVDYPNYPSIPQTSFKCAEQKYSPGFYADLETDCQVFHFCFDNRHESFLCPTGTTFNQPILACDMWYSSNCSLAPLFYVVNSGPGIESAGKKVPMLLKLRDRAKDGFTTMASVSNVFEKISALSGESIQQETNKVSEATATVTIDNVQHEAKDAGNVSEIMSDAIKLESSVSDSQDQSTGNFENDDQEPLSNGLDSSNGNFAESQEELNNESNIENLIYDPVTDGYFMQEYPDSEWPAESDPNSQFQSFYDFGNFERSQMMQDEGESVQFQDINEGETYSNEEDNAPETFQFDDGSQREYYDEMNAFSKRLQTIGIPKRTRRKPTYIVVDQSDVRFPTGQRQDLYPVLKENESPFDESISIDSVIEESSTEFMEYSDAADENEEFESDKDWNESYEETESDTSDFESDYSEDSNLSSRPSESDFGLSDDQAENDLETSEFDKFREIEDRSMNIENLTVEDSVAESEQESIDEINTEDESDDGITIYDDLTDPEVYGSEQNVGSLSMEEQDTVIIIPDETDLPTTSEDNAMGPSSDNVEYESDRFNQNWQYVYSEASDIPQNSESDVRYMYVDGEGNEKRAYEMENGEGTYDPSEYSQQNYAYPGTYAEMNYPQYQQSEYDFTDQENPNYMPRSYYQYMPEDKESLSDQEPSEGSNETLEDGSDSEENPDSSEFDSQDGDYSRVSSNVPSNLYSYESPDGQSYGYNYIYPQMQSYMNDFSYGPQYGYSYEGVDGSLYSNEGDESQSSVESGYVTESSAAGLPLAPEYEGLQETWAQTDFEAENSAAIGEEESEANGSQEFETEGGYTFSYDELGSERPNVDFNMQDTESKFANFEGSRQNEETYYVLEDEDTDETLNFATQTAEEIEEVSNETNVNRQIPMSSDSNFDHNDFTEKNILDNFEPSKAFNAPRVVYSDSESMLNIPNEGILEGIALSELGIKTDSMSSDNNFNSMSGSWQSHGLDSYQENEKPDVLSSARDHPAGKQSKVSPTKRDFMSSTETQFVNSVPFPNTMDFSPYAFGANMGQQFAMMDSSNRVPFSKNENRIPPEAVNSGMSRLSKLSSLQDKVRSMKRGRFGMFKKYMNSMKNYKE